MKSLELRKNKNQHVVKNIDSIRTDIKIKNVVDSLITTLKTNYPNVEFGVDSSIKASSLARMVKGTYHNDASFVRPDGGFVWMKIKNKKYYILIVEGKNQGTNDLRLVEGKQIQAQGNAIERIGKNFDASEILFGNEDILPFIAFIQGCDFNELSTINDRLYTILKFTKFNEVHLYKKQIMKTIWNGGSFFVKGNNVTEEHLSSSWTKEEIIKPLLHIAINSKNYYERKYS